MSIIVLLPLLGGTWILGLLFLIDNDSVALAWIFTIVNSLQVCICTVKSFLKGYFFVLYAQGAAMFFFYVVRNKEVNADHDVHMLVP